MVQEKPCRTCHDFKEWTKIQKRTFDTEKEQRKIDENDEVNYANRKSLNCPLDKDELGSAAWSYLHTMAAKYPENPSTEDKTIMKSWFHGFARFYPCEYCAEDLRKQLEVLPPETNSQEELSQWLCRIHNNVNKKLGKPIFNCKLVNQRWRDGWLDGSCD